MSIFAIASLIGYLVIFTAITLGLYFGFRAAKLI